MNLANWKAVVTTIIDREPDFEDDKIRMWRASREGTPPPGKSDETVLPVDLEKEEIYESRSYPLLAHPATLALIVRRWLGIEGTPSDAPALLETIQSVVEESSLKVLAKRNRNDLRITYLVTAVGPEARTLIDRAEAVDEAAYRVAVAELEEDLLKPGIIGEPIVVGPEDWKTYEQAAE